MANSTAGNGGIFINLLVLMGKGGNQDANLRISLNKKAPKSIGALFYQLNLNYKY